MKRFYIMILHIGFSISIPSAVASVMKEECVGRIQFSLPEDAEVAAISSDDFLAKLIGGAAYTPFRFADGQIATYSDITYSGLLLSTHSVSDAQKHAFRKAASDSRSRMDVAVNQEHKKGPDGLPLQFESLSTNGHEGVAWRVDTKHTAYIEVGDHAILWRVQGSQPEDLLRFSQIYRILASGLQVRPIFAIPGHKGVCLPNIFIRDNGRANRSVRTTFRLRSHPDVHILLEDTNALILPALVNRRQKTPSEVIADFWQQYQFSYTAREIEYVWNDPEVRPVLLGGRAGVASFVKIRRTNGTVDFGYLAISPGEAKASHDTPEVQLHAVREALQAEKLGIKPIGEDEFLLIVDKIAKSIKFGAATKLSY
jgi:hypothetical protein